MIRELIKELELLLRVEELYKEIPLQEIGTELDMPVGMDIRQNVLRYVRELKVGSSKERIYILWDNGAAGVEPASVVGLYSTKAKAEEAKASNPELSIEEAPLDQAFSPGRRWLT